MEKVFYGNWENYLYYVIWDFWSVNSNEGYNNKSEMREDWILVGMAWVMSLFFFSDAKEVLIVKLARVH